ncbi:MAG: hypothetical protein OXB93_01575 [Cytophagales bacterium]|nr:hypothetical protein [Cytophagales bacterium]
MDLIFVLRPLLVGLIHSLEPDHVATVSTLAAERVSPKLSLKSIQSVSSPALRWALGHIVAVFIFGALALGFKKTLILWMDDFNSWSYLGIGILMCWIGLFAIHRSKSFRGGTENSTEKKITLNIFSKSFWIGMMHGAAGSGGLLGTVLVLHTESLWDAFTVVSFECIGILLGTGIYAILLAVVANRFAEKNTRFLKWINILTGTVSLGIGAYTIYDWINLS